MSQTEIPEAPADTDEMVPYTKAESFILHCLQTDMRPVNEQRQNLPPGTEGLHELLTFDLINDAFGKPDPTDEDMVAPDVFDAVYDRLEKDRSREELLRAAVYRAPNQEMIDYAAPRLLEIANRYDDPLKSANDCVNILNRSHDETLRGPCLLGILGAAARYDTKKEDGIRNAGKALDNVDKILASNPDLAKHEGVMDALAALHDHEHPDIAAQSRHLVLAHTADQGLAEKLALELADAADRQEDPVTAANDYVRVLNRTKDGALRKRCLKGVTATIPRYDMAQENHAKIAGLMAKNVAAVMRSDAGLATPEVMEDLLALTDHPHPHVAKQSRIIVIAAANQDVKKAVAAKLLDASAETEKNPLASYQDHLYVLSHVQDEALQERCVAGMVNAIADTKDYDTNMQMQQGMGPFLKKYPVLANKLVGMADHPNPETAAYALSLGMKYCDEKGLLPLQQAALELAGKHQKEKPGMSGLLLTNTSLYMDENHPLCEQVVTQTLSLMQHPNPNLSMYAIHAAERLVPAGDARAVEMQQRWAGLYDTLKHAEARALVAGQAVQVARPGGPLSAHVLQCIDNEATSGANFEQLFGVSDFSDQNTSPVSNTSYGYHRSNHADGSPRVRVARDLHGRQHGLQVLFEQGDGDNMDGDASSVTWMEHGAIDKDRTALLRQNLSELVKKPGWDGMSAEERNTHRAQETKRTLGL